VQITGGTTKSEIRQIRRATARAGDGMFNIKQRPAKARRTRLRRVA
jgi:hypothetical protein